MDEMKLDFDFDFSFEIPSKYETEIVFVIDSTGSMNRFTRMLRYYEKDFYRMISESLEKEGILIDDLRVKVINFKDFAYDGDEAIRQSRFFNLPEEKKEFFEWVPDRTFGGGDEPESALEAIAVAMRSDWTTEKIPDIKRRHVILVFTDASAAPLKDASRPGRSKCSRIENPAYPENMPNNLEELEEMWNGTSNTLKGMPDRKAKRIGIFAPDVWPWNTIAEWDQCFWNPCRGGCGLSDVSIYDVVNIIVQCYV